ncbi:hypothetical protein BGW42_006020 [Actinomortierella wolfii]|nr:hypothetical protein BGW42_006020 [Actinomortierella wolfii]
MPLVVTKISRGSTLSHRVEILRRKLHGLEEDDPEDYNHAMAWDLNVEIADLLRDEESYGEAKKYYQQALSHAEQDKTRKVDYRERAKTEEFKEAFQYAEEYLNMAVSVNDLWEQVRARQSLGDTLLHEGETISEEEKAMVLYKNAANHYGAAKALLSKLKKSQTPQGPTKEQIQVHLMLTSLNSGIINTKLKRLSEAQSDLTIALTICMKIGDTTNERNVYMNLAILAEANGDLDQVTKYQQIELDFVRKHGLWGEMECLFDMARVYRLRKMYDKSIEMYKGVLELTDDPEAIEAAEEYMQEVIQESQSGDQDSNSVEPLEPSQPSPEDHVASQDFMEVDEPELDEAPLIKSPTPEHQDDAPVEIPVETPVEKVPRRRLFRKSDIAFSKQDDDSTCTVRLEPNLSTNLEDIYRFGFLLLEPMTITFQRVDFNNIGWLKQTIQKRFQDWLCVKLDIGAITIPTSTSPLLDTELLEPIAKDGTVMTVTVNGIEQRPMPEIYKEVSEKLEMHPRESVMTALASIGATADFRFLNDTCERVLSQLLYSPTLKHLYLTSNKITGKTLKRMLSSWPFYVITLEPHWLSKLPKPALETLDLSFNPLGESSGLEYIASCVDRFPALKKLDLSHCRLSMTSLSAAMENWEKIEQLQNAVHQGLEISLTRNSFSTEETLELRYAQLDGSAMEVLAEGIAANSSLLSLDLTGNPIGSFEKPTPTATATPSSQPVQRRHSGTPALAASLRRHLETRSNSRLKKLILADCRLQTQDCIPLFNTHLQELSLAHNPLLNTPQDADQLTPLIVPPPASTADASGPNMGSDKQPTPELLKRLDLSCTFPCDDRLPFSGEPDDLTSKLQDLMELWRTDSRHSGGFLEGSSAQGPVLVLISKPNTQQ